MINCPSCGAGLRYDIESAQMKCESCSGFFDPYIFEKTDKDAEITVSEYDTRVWVCPGCGARLETTDENDITSVCSYCGNHRIIFDNIKSNRRPETIIPFEITKEDCKKAYLKAAHRAFLSPGRLVRADQIESFRGIYMPYWSYLSVIISEYQAVAKHKVEYRDGDYICTDNYNVTGEITASFSDVTHDASEQFDDDISEALAPYDDDKEKKFSPGFLSGFYAESDNVEMNEYLDSAIDDMKNAVNTKVKKQLDPKYVLDDSSAKIANIQVIPKRTLYPVWFMSCRKKDKLTYAAVNGLTGKVVADFPISVVKFLLLAFLIADAVFLLMEAANVMLMPKTALMLSAIMSIVAWFINNKRYSDLMEKRQRKRTEKTKKEKTGKSKASSKKSTGKNLTALLIALFPLIIILSIGSGVEMLLTVLLLVALAAAAKMTFSEKNKENKKVPRDRIIFLILLAVSIVLSAIIQIIRPLNMFYYYAAAINAVSFIVQIIVTFNLINKIAYRMPAQFNKTGGDDNA